MLVSALRTFLSGHYLPIHVSEFGGADGGGGGVGGGSAELPPIVQNDLVTIVPVLLEAAGAAQACHPPSANPNSNPNPNPLPLNAGHRVSVWCRTMM